MNPEQLWLLAKDWLSQHSSLEGEGITSPTPSRGVIYTLPSRGAIYTDDFRAGESVFFKDV